MLPLLDDIEQDSNITDVAVADKYDFYFRNLVRGISFRHGDNKDIELWITIKEIESVFEFVARFALTNEHRPDPSKSENYTSMLREHLNCEHNASFDYDILVSDSKAYQLLKETWIGHRITSLATMRKRLEEKFAASPDEEDNFFVT